MNNSHNARCEASLFLDLDGLVLTDEEKVLLLDPLIGGVILFARNTQNAKQVAELVASIRAIRPDLILSLDQEGGRVQRLKEGVTLLPPVKALSEFSTSIEENSSAAKQLGYLMAVELRQLDIDLSFAPVVDIDYGRNTVIGNRAFGSDVSTVTALSSGYIEGMRDAGMPATVKHFPGHGWANADTHHADAIDEREFTAIEQTDMVPFKEAITNGVEAMMFAHVLYPQCDASPAGFSDFWIGDVLREGLGYQGAIFSDDLSMKAAHSAGGYAKRAEHAIRAGCQVLLCCNDRKGSLAVLEYMRSACVEPYSALSSLKGKAFKIDEVRLEQARVLASRLMDVNL